MHFFVGSGSFYELVGKATTLWNFADYHELDAAVFKYRILRPIKLRQCRILVDRHGNPVCYVTWAFLPEEEPTGNLGSQLLSDEDWKSGPHMHIIDFIAPFGGVIPIVKHLARDSLATYASQPIWRAWRRQHKSIAARSCRINLLR